MTANPSFVPLSPEKPWPGLRAFTEGEHAFFFGREDETRELLGLVERAPVVVLYGDSGLGKTSLLQAGVMRELKSLDFVPVLLRLNHDPSAPPLERQVFDALAETLERANVSVPAPGENETLWEYFHRHDLEFWGPKTRLLMPVILFDQFEEIFTLGRRTLEVDRRSQRFLSELECVLEHRAPAAVAARLEANDDARFDPDQRTVKFVFSMREDFLAEIDDLAKKRMPSLQKNRLRLYPLSEKQALKVIVSSGKELVSEPVAREIVEFLTTERKQSATKTVAPALLSVVCDELNRRRIERGDAHITSDLLSGEREEIIQNFYERAFEGIAPEVREWLEDELLTSLGHRDHAALEDAIRAGIPESAIDTLVDRWLLNRYESNDVIWLEFIHDLVTEPAAHSRSERAQRREAELARDRAASVARELRRARMTAAFFAGALLLSLVALAFAFNERGKAKQAAKEAIVSRDSARAMQKQAQVNFANALQLTERLGFDLTGSIWTPTPALKAKIPIAEESYRKLRDTKKDADVHERYAHFLATAARALYQTGHFREGMEKAEAAAEEIAAIPATKNGERENLTRAETLQAEGEGKLATGQLSAAEDRLKNAIRAAEKIPYLDAARVRVLSTIALAKVAVARFDDPQALRHLDEATRLIDTCGFSTDEVETWRAMVLLQRAVASEESVGTRHIEQARGILRTLLARAPQNYVLQRLAAEIEYHHGYIAFRLGNSTEAEASFRRAQIASEALTKRDPDNLEWKYGLGQTLRGLGFVLEVAPDLSLPLYTRTRDIAAELENKQPQWVRPRFLHAAALLDLGDVASARASAAGHGFTKEETRELLNDADKHYGDAGALFQKLVDEMREYKLFVADLARAEHRQAQISIDREQYQDALARDRRAYALLENLPASQEVLESKADYKFSEGYSHYFLEQYREAIAAYETELRILEQCVTIDPRAHHDIALAHFWLTYAHLATKEDAKAYRDIVRAMKSIDRALNAIPVGPRTSNLLADKAAIHHKRAEMLLARDEIGPALDELTIATKTAWSGLEAEYGHSALNERLKSARQLGEAIAKSLADDGERASIDAAMRARWRQRIEELAQVADAKQLQGHVASAHWSVDPLIPGGWQNVPQGEISAMTRGLRTARIPVAAPDIQQVRRLTLPFYRDVVLCESEVSVGNGDRGIVSWLVRGKTTRVLEGDLKAINAVNQENGPLLDTNDRAAAYLRFYVNAVGDTDGRLKIIDTADDLVWKEEATPEQRAKAVAAIKPLTLEPSRSGFWQGIGTVQYGAALLHASFQLKRNGSVRMEYGSPAVPEPLPLVPEIVIARVRRAKPADFEILILQDRLAINPQDADAMEALPRAYSKQQRFADAVQAQKRWIDFVNLDPSRAKNRTETLPGEYLSLSWQQLMARDFEGALASTDTGRALDPDYIELDTNRAHALLFLGRTKEAEELYYKHIGKLIMSTKRKWEDVILEDLDLLEKAGVTNEQVARIREGIHTALNAPKG